MRECIDCNKITKCLSWGGVWLCMKCIEESTIEGVVVGAYNS